MANHTRNGNGTSARAVQSTGTPPGLTDAAPRSRVLYDYDIPDDDGLWSEVTLSFGSLRSISLKLLSPLEEKDAAHAAKGDPLVLAYELTRRSLVEVTNDRGESIKMYNHDGTLDELWSQMHPKIRSMAMQAYAENSAPNNRTSTSFIASRRIRA